MKIWDPALPRCAWARNNAIMRYYHDNEWGIPQHNARVLWEMLILEGFQAGLSWMTVLHKRAAFREVFCGFDPQQVATFTEQDVQCLLANENIIRSRAKIESTIASARIYCKMEACGEFFDTFCWQFTCGNVLKEDGVRQVAHTLLSAQISSELKKRGFKFVGPTIVYAWMQAVGIVNNHSIECFCRER